MKAIVSQDDATKGKSADCTAKVSHTPGPWTTESIESENRMGSTLFIIPVNNSEDWIAKLAGHGAYKADAMLIAAAPELLDALRDLLAWANLDRSTNPKTVALRDKCEFAIKNAGIQTSQPLA